jgi:hypothetical protein
MVGVMGKLQEFALSESPPHPLASLATSPRKRGQVPDET